MIAAEFEFFAPRGMDELLVLLQEQGASCKILAGGMTLLPIMTLGLAQPASVISLNHLTGLDAVEDAGDVLRLGAMLRHATVATHPLILRHAPMLALAASGIGDVQVRHRGTLGGSLAHAEPAADYLCACAALGARFIVRSQDGERRLSIDDFFVDVMTTALAPNEVLVAVEIPKQVSGVGVAHKSLRRVEGAFPIVLASAVVAPRFARAIVGLGGVGPRPLAFDVTAELRNGLSPTALDAIGEQAFEAARQALSDLNGSGAYRRAMARIHARRAVQAAVANMQDGGRS